MFSGSARRKFETLLAELCANNGVFAGYFCSVFFSYICYISNEIIFVYCTIYKIRNHLLNYFIQYYSDMHITDII